MLECLAVGLGGFIGSVCRYLVGKIPLKNPAAKNIHINDKLMLFLKVGICGGFTTFSTFSLEAAELMKSGAIPAALLYIVLSAVLGILAVFAGQYVIR